MDPLHIGQRLPENSNVNPPSWPTRIATGSVWAWRRFVPFAKVADQLAHRFAPDDGSSTGIIGRVAQAWMDAAGPARQAELRLNDRLQTSSFSGDAGVALTRHHDELEALERVLNQQLKQLPPDDPIAPYQPSEVNLQELLQQHRQTVGTFCSRAAHHGAMAAVVGLLGKGFPGLQMNDLTTCMRSAIAGLPRWNGWHQQVEAGLVPATEEGLGDRIEALFMAMLKEKGLGWGRRLQARMLYRGLSQLLGHALPRLGSQVLQALHQSGEESRLGEFLGPARQLIELVSHHLQQVVRVQRWAAAGRPFFNEQSGHEEGSLESGETLLDRELRKATYHQNINWNEACKWCNRYIADRWASNLFGYSENLTAWMSTTSSADPQQTTPRGVAIVWVLFQKALFYLRLPLIATAVLILRLIESWILNPLARFAVLKVLESQKALDQGIESVMQQLRPSPELQLEGDQVATFQGYSYPLDQGLRTLYRMVRQLMIHQREQPVPPPERLQRLKDGSRLHLELDEQLQNTAASMTRNLIEVVQKLPTGVAKPRRWLLGFAQNRAQTASLGVTGVGRILTLLTHDPLLRQQPAEGLKTGLEAFYSLDPEPSLTEKREMHNLQRLSRRWMLRELTGLMKHETSRAIRGDDRKELEQELAHFHLRLLQSLPNRPDNRGEQGLWFQEIQRVVQLWEKQMRELSIREQIESEFEEGDNAVQVYVQIERLLRRMQVMIRLTKISDIGAKKRNSLQRRQQTSLETLQNWRKDALDRSEQLKVLLNRLIRQTPIRGQGPLLQARSHLEHLSEALREMTGRLTAQATTESQTQADHERWSSWRRQWQFSVRAVREAQQHAQGLQGPRQTTANQNVAQLLIHHHRMMSKLPPPHDPEGRWQRLCRHNPNDFFRGASVEELLDWGAGIEAEHADGLARCAQQRRYEGTIAQGLELLMHGTIRVMTHHSALNSQDLDSTDWREPGDLALLIACSRSSPTALAFQALKSHLEHHNLVVPDEISNGCREELVLEGNILSLRTASSLWRQISSHSDEMPLYGPDWRAPTAWQEAAQTIQNHLPEYFNPHLQERGAQALTAWRSLIASVPQLHNIMSAKAETLTKQLIQLREPATQLGVALLSEGLESEEVIRSWYHCDSILQEQAGHLVHRIKQLSPLCVPSNSNFLKRWFWNGLAGGAAKMAPALVGAEKIGHHFLETLLSPPHVRGVLRELVSRVGNAYACTQNITLKGPRHRAMRDGAATLN